METNLGATPVVPSLSQKMDSCCGGVVCLNMKRPHIVAWTDNILLRYKHCRWFKATVVGKCVVAICVCRSINNAPKTDMRPEVFVQCPEYPAQWTSVVASQELRCWSGK